MLQRPRDGVDVNGPAQKSDAPRLGGLLRDECQLSFEPVGVGARPPPTKPSPPPFDTAAANAPPAQPPIGASTIGNWIDKDSVSTVVNAMGSIIYGRGLRRAEAFKLQGGSEHGC